jgi:hypothetical protein
MKVSSIARVVGVVGVVAIALAPRVRAWPSRAVNPGPPARRDVPEDLAGYVDKVPLVRLAYNEMPADPRGLWFDVSVFDDGLVAYFVHPCAQGGGLRARRIRPEQLSAIAALSREECDSIVTDDIGEGCTDTPAQRVFCTGASGARFLRMDCHLGRGHGARFIRGVLDLVGLAGINGKVDVACRSADSDPVIVHSDNPFALNRYLRGPSHAKRR